MITEGEIMDAIRRPLGAKLRRSKTQNESRNGALPGRLLFPENDGDPCERTP